VVVKRALRSAAVPAEEAAVATVSECPLCGRPIAPSDPADEHHLIPRSKGGREKTLLHKLCHKTIHATLTETELARTYNTWAALQAHPQIARYIQWVRTKPTALVLRAPRRPRR
jgi:5-methylcytosine-specific restriction endonuclease McrA